MTDEETKVSGPVWLREGVKEKERRESVGRGDEDRE